ncbi:MAG: hypothetical protein HZA54_00775 [Planctomycetes bacterium]|nr:hypothetical protein [Planctomycetota bacterium]
MWNQRAGMWGARGGGAAVLVAGLLGWAGPGWACDSEELDKELAKDAALDRAGGGATGGESEAGSPLSRRERVRPPDERWVDYNRYFTWYESVAAARAAALQERKLLFVVQMVGNLRDGGT